MRTLQMMAVSLMFMAATASIDGQVTSSGGTLRAGASRVEITPPAAPGSPAPAYEHERLYVRAIVLDNGTTRAALIRADQSNLPEEVWMAASKDIAAELNAPIHNSQGASGDQNPLYLRSGTNLMASRTGVPITGNVMVREKVEGPLRDGAIPATPGDPKVRDALLRWIDAQGMLLGEEVIRVMTDTASFDSRPNIRGAQKTISCPGRTRTGGAREGGPGQYAGAEPVQLRLTALIIGTTALASVNAEVYSPIARRLTERSPLSNTVTVTLANGRAGSGYIPDDASYGHYTFQVNGSRLEPGCAETAIANGLAGLIAEPR